MSTPDPATTSPSARRLVARALKAAAERFPDLDAQALDTAPLRPRDAALAVAVHRTVLQRWLTIRHVLAQFTRQPFEQLEPAMQAVLLSGAAQLLFMDRMPARAVVNETVNLAKRMVRFGAAGLANALLRRVAEQVQATVRNEPWQPLPDRLPIEDGYVRLASPLLPDPVEAEHHWSVATSHPVELIRAWQEEHGPEATQRLCLAGLRIPPTVVAVEAGFREPAEDRWQPHQQPGFVIWQAGHDELVEFLSAHPHRRVQDPAAALAVAATASLRPKLIVDYCAGFGTKTKQLVAMHPQARIVATDPDPDRLAELKRVFAEEDRVVVTRPQKAAEAFPGHRPDLLVLDVPCSNTAVLARRPEARYRFGARSLESLVELQRQIMRTALSLVGPEAHVLYSTCSVVRQENQQQAAWLAQQWPGQIAAQHLELPGGSGTGYHDGGYWALVRR